MQKSLKLKLEDLDRRSYALKHAYKGSYQRRYFFLLIKKALSFSVLLSVLHNFPKLPLLMCCGETNSCFSYQVWYYSDVQIKSSLNNDSCVYTLLSFLRKVENEQAGG